MAVDVQVEVALGQGHDVRPADLRPATDGLLAGRTVRREQLGALAIGRADHLDHFEAGQTGTGWAARPFQPGWALGASRTHGTGEWCRQTLGYRLDLDHASPDLQEWVITEMDRTRPDVAAALHECFEAIDVRPLLPGIKTPVLLLSGDKSRIASEQQKILADRLPHGRLELFAGYGHGVNLLQPERCARAALDFWRTVEAEDK